jgi:uncharacterized protein
MVDVLRTGVRVLGDEDVPAVLDLCAQDPVANVFVSSRVAVVGADPRRLGGQLWGHHRRGRLVAACWAGANLVPVGADEAALDVFATRARRSGRQCSSIVGPAPAVLGLWDRLAGGWGPAREVRRDQPLMVLDGEPRVPPDPAVRRTELTDMTALVPACVAMFTEEVGYSPNGADGGATYRRRVRELVVAGRSFARFDGDDPERPVVFKAELGAVGQGVAQVQGVWVAPRHRGRGLAAPGMAAVAALTRRHVAPVVSLYVNAWNTRAVAVYEQVGFRRTGTFATVLF